MTLSPRTIARSILRWDWLSCVSSAARRTRFMCGSNPSRIPRYPRPPFNSTITFELILWLRRESGLIMRPRRSHGGGVLKGLREAVVYSDGSESLEVNASPGFRGLLETTGVNAVDAMFEYIVQKAKAGNPKRP